MIIERDIGSMDQLCRELNDLPNHFIFRGQADAAWSLQSALERFVGSKWSQAKEFEDYSLQQFRSKYQIYKGSEQTPKSILGWLCAMQHYGIPTRLIDFTMSPYVALYFALEDYAPRSLKAFSIFALDYTAIMEKSIELVKVKDQSFNETRATVSRRNDEVFEYLIENGGHNVLWVAEPSELNARVDRQCGTFLTSRSLERPIHSVVMDEQYDSCRIIKYKISPELYSGASVALRKMNISSKSIYGDLAGLARGIRMEIQPYTI